MSWSRRWLWCFIFSFNLTVASMFFCSSDILFFVLIFLALNCQKKIVFRFTSARVWNYKGGPKLPNIYCPSTRFCKDLGLREKEEVRRGKWAREGVVYLPLNSIFTNTRSLATLIAISRFLSFYPSLNGQKS